MGPLLSLRVCSRRRIIAASILQTLIAVNRTSDPSRIASVTTAVLVNFPASQECAQYIEPAGGFYVFGLVAGEQI